MNPRIKNGWEWLWNLKPSVAMTKNELIMHLHRWQTLVHEEFKRNLSDEDLAKMAEEIFK